VNACHHCVEQQRHAPHGSLRRRAVAAQPVENVDQPDVALRHVRRRIKPGQQALQVMRCSSHKKCENGKPNTRNAEEPALPGLWRCSR
jgi:hypothetical protein